MPRRTPMRRSCSTSQVARATGVAVLLLLAGCGSKATDAPAAAGSAAPAAGGEDGQAAATGGAMATAAVAQAAAPALAGRPRELVNPDHATVVFLYYDLAGVTPPIDTWVEEDSQVKYGPGPQKAPRRAALKAELAAGAAGVRDVGRIRLSMNANLTPYDPTYGEFTVRALSPSSYVEFKEFGQQVALRFTNGRTAQVWKVPAEQAQAISDRLGYSSADMDVLLEITGVRPAASGGSIEARIVEYELRDTRGGTKLGRVRVDPAG